MNKNAMFRIIWIIIITVGSVLGNDVVPNNWKYITGFIFGCLSMGVLMLVD